MTIWKGIKKVMKSEGNNVNPYRSDFPIFSKQSVVYLDNAATAQKPVVVLEAEMKFYENYNANPLRGLYELSIEATRCYEEARNEVQRFIKATTPEEIIFTRNTTEAINLVAYSYGLSNVKSDEEIVVTIMEHHSNLLPWQMVSRKTGAKLKFIECSEEGEISEEAIKEVISSKTKIVAVTFVSNVFGRVNPVEKIIQQAHKVGSIVVLDAAQAAPHIPIDVTKLDVDFLAFSGHKLMGPMGIGVLYGKKEILEEMEPFMTGGEMIESVHRNGAVFAPLPEKFEAGTVNVAGAIGLAEAIKYINKVGFDAIREREELLTAMALQKLREIPEVCIIGSKNPSEHCGIITFTVEGVHPHDVASILDSWNIAVRAGHHCAQPLMEYLKVNSTVRASIAFYNSIDDINKFAEAVRLVRSEMGYEK